MDEQSFGDVGKEFNWQEKPVFPVANEENKKLEEELLKKKQYNSKLRSHADEQSRRIKLMKEHYHDVELELSYTEKLQRARKHELETEEHLFKLSHREKTGVLKEIQEMEKDMERVKERAHLLQIGVDDQSNRKETLASTIQWDQQVLEAWLEESVKQEEDRMALLKYTKQDDHKIMDLALLLERSVTQLQKTKSQLEHCDTDVFASQAEMDRVEEDFRKAHQERQDIIADWEKVLFQIHQRHQDIDNATKNMEQMKEVERDCCDKLDEEKLFLSREERNNKELEFKLSSVETHAATLRKENTTETEKETTLNAELEAMKTISSYIGYQLRRAQGVNIQLNQTKMDKNNKLQQLEKENEQLQNDLNNLTKETMTEEMRSRHLDELQDKEEKHKESLDKDHSYLTDIHRKNTEKLTNLEIKEKTMKAELKGVQAASTNLSHKISKIDTERFHQQSILYKSDFEIQQTEQRIRQMMGDTKDQEQQAELEVQVAEVKAILDQKQKSLSFITQQIKVADDKISQCRRILDKNKLENLDQANKLEALQLTINNCNKILKSKTDKKESLLVDDCLIKLQLKRLQELLGHRADSVCSLQKHQLEFEKAMKERQQEINSCKEMLQAEFRIEDQSRQKLLQQVQEWSTKAEKLHTRYTVLMGSLGMGDTGDGEGHEDILVQMENEKREAQREIEELTFSTERNKEELHALRNSLQLVWLTNQNFRETINPPNLEDRDYERLNELEQEQHGLSVQTFEKEQEVLDLENNIAFNEEKMLRLEDQLRELKITNHKKEVSQENLLKEISDQREKLHRADRQNSKHAVDIKSTHEIQPFDSDIKVRLLRELRNRVSKLVVDCVKDDFPMMERIQYMFTEANLPPLPSPGSTPGSSRSSSRASLAAASRISISRRPSQTSSLISTVRSGSRALTVSSTEQISPSVVSLGSDLPAFQPGSSRRVPRRQSKPRS